MFFLLLHHHHQYCWIRPGSPAIYSVVVPLAVVVGLNLILFVLIVLAIRRAAGVKSALKGAAMFFIFTVSSPV